MSDFVGLPPYFFCELCLISNVAINIHEYVNKIISISDQCLCHLSRIWQLVSKIGGIL